jgi:hypothetical protein
MLNEKEENYQKEIERQKMENEKYQRKIEEMEKKLRSSESPTVCPVLVFLKSFKLLINKVTTIPI